MSAPKRLSSLADVTGAAHRPTYEPARHGHGIVHLGIGAFHRAHRADYTDAALAAAGGDWRIVGASLRSVELADALNPQNGLYTLIERDASEVRARLIGSIERVIAASRAPADLMTSLIDRRTRIVTMTVTEKAYGVDRATMTVDVRHLAIAADLRDPYPRVHAATWEGNVDDDRSTLPIEHGADGDRVGLEAVVGLTLIAVVVEAMIIRMRGDHVGEELAQSVEHRISLQIKVYWN